MVVRQRRILALRKPRWVRTTPWSNVSPSCEEAVGQIRRGRRRVGQRAAAICGPQASHAEHCEKLLRARSDFTRGLAPGPKHVGPVLRLSKVNGASPIGHLAIIYHPL